MANYKQISAGSQIKVGAGKLKGILASTVTSTPSIIVYDGMSASDPKIIDTLTLVAGTNYAFPTDGIFFSKGLFIALTGTASFTVIYE